MLVALALSKASLGQAQMGDSKFGLEWHLCWVKTTRSPKAESEALPDTDERERSLSDRKVEYAVSMITKLSDHPFGG